MWHMWLPGPNVKISGARSAAAALQGGASQNLQFDECAGLELLNCRNYQLPRSLDARPIGGTENQDRDDAAREVLLILQILISSDQ